jgi:ferredoxin
MAAHAAPPAGRHEGASVFEACALQALFDALGARGYRVVGPTIREGAIVYGDVTRLADLPVGWTDVHEPGRYRLARRTDDAYFGYVVGPTSLKRFLFPPEERIWEAHRDGKTFSIRELPADAPKTAFLGVRACELAALGITDRVFTGGAVRDERYAARRDAAVIVAVNCAEARGTCFCVSMGTGPKARAGYDVALTELLDTNRHDFLAEAGSEAGAELLAALERRPATQADLAAASEASSRAAAQMGRRLDTSTVKERLQANPNDPRWDDVAARCLSCGNCTMVCPTCFCSTIEDATDLRDTVAERTRKWDSCFTMDFSYLHGGSVRDETRTRYRQWLTHKFATWVDQFGTSGCVGCGRCITWCPVGIDVTVEAAAVGAGGQRNEVNDGHD